MVANGSGQRLPKSSAWQELWAVMQVCTGVIFQSKLQNERVRWFTDNQNVVRIVQHGSCKPALQVEAWAIFSIYTSNHICMGPKWVPREQNQLAVG